MSTSTSLMELQESMDSSQELTICHILTQIMEQMQLISWKLICLRIYQVCIIMTILAILALHMQIDSMIKLFFKSSQDFQYLDNGKLIGIWVITCQLNIICFKIHMTLMNSLLKLILCILGKTHFLKTIESELFFQKVPLTLDLNYLSKHIMAPQFHLESTLEF